MTTPRQERCEPVVSKPLAGIGGGAVPALGNSEGFDRSLLTSGMAAPDWIATPPREAFFVLGAFAAVEARRAGEPGPLGAVPAPEGIAARLDAWMARLGEAQGAALLRRLIRFAVSRFSFAPDCFVAELVAGVLGAPCPTPRMLPHAEVVLNDHLMRALFDDRPPRGRFRIAAFDGANSAFTTILRTLINSAFLSPGDVVAVRGDRFGTISALCEGFGLHVVLLEPQTAETGGALGSLASLLENPRLRALLLVDPEGSEDASLGDGSGRQIAALIRARRPDLIVLTDESLGSFAAADHSMIALAPENTIAIQSFAKLYGCAGWRLAVVALHEDNLFDRMLSARGGSPDPERGLQPLIDRLVVEAWRGTPTRIGGLSTPQQVMMTLFAMWTRIGEDEPFRQAVRSRLAARESRLRHGLGDEVREASVGRRYHAAIDLDDWLLRVHGRGFASHVRVHLMHVDILYRLARRYGLVLRGGVVSRSGSRSLIVCLASTPEDVCERVGAALREITEEMRSDWLAAGGPSPGEGA